MNTGTYHGIKVYNGILEQLKSIHDTENDSLNEVCRYAREFHRETDFNLAQYGNMLVYYDQIREFYKNCEYSRIELMDTDELWDMYKNDVGYVAARVVSGKTNPLPMNMYQMMVYLNKNDIFSVMDWVSEHEEDSKHLDYTHFEDLNNSYRAPVVSLYRGNSTLEQSVSYLNEERGEIELYKNVRYHKSGHVKGLYYFQVHGNVYYCTN